MIKYSLFLATVLATSVAAYAALAPGEPPRSDSRNVTIINKNQAWPALEPLVIEYCGLEDCSDTPENEAL